jgi:hypothetical protein
VNDVSGAQSCGHGAGKCSRTSGVRMYLPGLRCPDHTPARLAGTPEPDAARSCAPKRCYCGRCPSWRTDTVYPVGEETVLDVRAVASGRRRSSLRAYRAAQAKAAKKR